MTIDQLRRKLGLPFNHNTTLQQMREYGIEPPRRPATAPKAPPPPPRQ